MTAIRTIGFAAASRGFHLGDGLFETVLVVKAVAGARPCFLDAHLARMRASGVALGVPVPADLDAVVAEHLEAMWDEEFRPPRAALRISVGRGPWAGIDVAPGEPADVVLALRALPGHAPSSLAAVVLDAPRIDPAGPLAGHKVLSWMDMVEARRRARAAGYDTAILPTVDGDVAETDAANLFLAVDGTVWTPPLSRGVLPGITRARVLAALRTSGRAVHEVSVHPAALARAEEVFVTSSLVGVVGVRRLGDRLFPGPGPVTQWLADCVTPDGETARLPGG